MGRYHDLVNLYGISVSQMIDDERVVYQYTRDVKCVTGTDNLPENMISPPVLVRFRVSLSFICNVLLIFVLDLCINILSVLRQFTVSDTSLIPSNFSQNI